jgi:hypothetical protein
MCNGTQDRWMELDSSQQYPEQPFDSELFNLNTYLTIEKKLDRFINN